MSIEPTKPLYFKKLDALRFVAFFLVFWQHGFATSFVNLSKNQDIINIIGTLTFTGGIGVHIFFVISGFLITFLMIKEQNEKGKVNIKNFYLRRILRIWPLYYFILLSGIFILPHLFKEFYFFGNLFNNLAFLNNFDMHDQTDNIGIAWSVAIEEQFYLFWPLLFVAFRNKKMLILTCLAIFSFSTYFVLTNHSPFAYFHTFSNLNYLMAGCVGAFFYSKYMKKPLLNGLMKPMLFYCAIFFAIVLPVSENFFVTGRYLCLLLLPIIYLYLVIYLVHNQDNNPASVFSLMGKYTYGMYLYHPIMIMLTKIIFDSLVWDYKSPLQNAILAIISLAVTIGFSILSYEYFEKHILKLKRKFGSVETRV